MKLIKFVVVIACAYSLLNGSGFGAEKSSGKLTCCQEAAANNKECKHRCCIAAHKDGKSCQKCNPNKEDMKKAAKKQGS
jgi:hypothetical protein